MANLQRCNEHDMVAEIIRTLNLSMIKSHICNAVPDHVTYDTFFIFVLKRIVQPVGHEIYCRIKLPYCHLNKAVRPFRACHQLSNQSVRISFRAVGHHGRKETFGISANMWRSWRSHAVRLESLIYQTKGFLEKGREGNNDEARSRKWETGWVSSCLSVEIYPGSHTSSTS